MNTPRLLPRLALLRPAAAVAALFVLAPLGCGGNKPAYGQDAAALAAAPLFTDAERRAVAAYWAAPGRYTVGAAPNAPMRVNVTTAGSEWYRRYLALVAARPKGDPEAAAWEAWFKARQSADRIKTIGGDPANYPAIPEALKTAMNGDAPPLYEKVQPIRYTVAFAAEDAPEPFVYTDAIPFGDRKAYYPHYRQTNGVQKMGKKVREFAGDDRKALDALFASVGRTEAERKVLQAVSALEGGFESVNTYDTGFVSIGLIQFIFAKNGDGSLAAVLARMKADDPAAFQADFRRFGIDVAVTTAASADPAAPPPPGPVVVAVDPTTAAEKRGADAVRAVIDDKRLTAVFERAGGRDPFRRAQVLIARERYWPGEDEIAVPPPAGTSAPAAAAADPATLTAAASTPPTPAPAFTCKVTDLFKSEAGLATLMDRKVNRGNLRGLNEAVAEIMRVRGLTRLEEVAAYERELIAKMKYRTDFLKDGSLTQPAALPR